MIKQHGFLEYYNSSSVNIIRITTLLWGNEIYNLGAILRVGAPGSFCDLVPNGNTAPLIIPVRDDGSLGKTAYDPDGFNKYDNVFGKRIEGFIPHYKDMVNLAAKAHEKYVNHRIIGWDFTIDTDGEIICVEYNSRCPGIVQSQIALGPIFDIKNAIGEAFLDCMKRGSL